MTAMPAELPYFDTSYLVRLYLCDHGFERVRELAGSGAAIASAWHAQAEIVAAFHRAFREGRLSKAHTFQSWSSLSMTHGMASIIGFRWAWMRATQSVVSGDDAAAFVS